MIGDTVDGRYRILRALGEGGMGAVYEAEHTGTGRRVALKVIRAQMTGKTEMVTRFQREARAAGAIETPHIVQVFDTGTDQATGVIYMAMELLHGEDVQHLLKRLGKLSPDLALRVVGQACLGLAKAHEAKVIHRDIKPANLFLSKHPSGEVTVKVVDFGIAKMVDPVIPDETALTETGGMLGSPLYMSPEQATGRKTIDHRTDIWSLGVMLYKALTGQVPHAGHDTMIALMMALCSEPAPPIQDLAPWVPPDVARIIHRMLARAPVERFPSMAAVLEALQPCLPRGLSIRVDDLVSISEEEQARVAPRAVLDGEAVTLSARPPRPNDAPSELTPAPSASEAARAIPAQAVSAPGEAPAAALFDAGLSVSQGAVVVAPTAPPRSRLRLGMALSLALGLGGLAAYKLGARPAEVASSPEPLASAAAPLASSSATAATAATAATPPGERVVRLAVEPADALIEVDGRATRVDDGSVEVRGVIGSVHHVRLVKGSQEASGEVAITSLGAVPAQVAIQAKTTAPRSALKTAGSKPREGAASPPAASPPALKPSGPAPAEKFE